ncbi:MAG: trigger factor [Akkermansiaceae bacterium]
MNITVDTLPDCIANMRAEIPAEKVQTERKSIVKAYAGQAKIPGFRPGKTPTSVVEKRFATDINQELEQRLISSACEEALKQNEELKVLNFQAPNEVKHEKDGSFTFSMSLILAPTFELPTYKGIDVKLAPAEATEEEVQREIDGVLQRYADYKDIEDRALETDDICVMDFTSTIDGKPLDPATGIIAGKEDYWIQLKEEAFLPGFHEQLIGAKVGDTVEVKTTLDAEFPVESVREKEITFSVTIKNIKEQTLPEFDDTFVAETLQFGEGKTVADLKELIVEQITAQKTKQIGEDKVNQIVENLLSNVDFVLPEELVKAETQNTADQMVSRGAQQGLTDEQISAQKDDIAAAAAIQARNNIKTNFILQEIANEEKITVTDNELLERIAAIAKQEKKAPKALIKELQRDGRIPSLRNSILIGKAIDFLVEHAKIEEETATEETSEA